MREGFSGIRRVRELYKPEVTALPLPWWRRVGLAFGVFFRVLFDGRYAASLAARKAGLEPPSVSGPVSHEARRPNVPANVPENPESALLLLSLLQAEGRFVDFVQQDLGAFSDNDVGAVARVVHSGCRKVLGAHLRIEAIRSEPEGQAVALEPGFDPNRIKLTGNVGGGGRLNGVLRHRGWHATDVRLPTVVDRAGALVLCPAEVEL